MSLPTRRLGDLEVSALGLGFMSFVRSADADEQRRAQAVVDAALERGLTLFDTADVYGPFVSETLLGRTLAAVRDRVVVATKFGNPVDRTAPGVREVDGRPEHVRRSIDGSLQRLGIDHVDLYYLHRVDPLVPIEETVGAMAELVTAGKVRHLGLSEPGPGTVRRAHATHPITAIQSEWSLFSRDVEESTVPVTRELGIGLVPYSPLGRGLLTGLVRERADVPERLRAHGRFVDGALEANVALAGEVRVVAAELGVAPAQVALAGVLGQGDDVVPIPGTRHVERLVENLDAVEVQIDPEQLDRLDALAARVLGERALRPAAIGVEAPLPATAERAS